MLLFDLEFEDLYTLEGLTKIHHIFLNYLKDSNEELYVKLLKAYEYDSSKDIYTPLAPYLEDFISYLFNIHTEVQLNQERHKTFSIVSKVKRLFIQRHVLRQQDFIFQKADLDFKNDLEFAKCVNIHLEPFNVDALTPYVNYALWAMQTEEGRAKHKDSVLFQTIIKKTSKVILVDNLVRDEVYKAKNVNERKGFSLSDKGLTLQKALDQAHYCIVCHKQNKDSCRKGISEQEHGCPLDLKISHMNKVKSEGYDIGALSIICIDNPLVPATGHRICNDCKKACIFQKQEAVDIPGIESQILKNVLNLPYGFEIYSLLTKWNPLNFKAPLPNTKTDHTVLVVGQGPAGFSLSHYLMRSGVQVLAIDGLKIEPIPSYLKNIKYPLKTLPYDDLSKRTVYGFGGVAEYGITPRWDKNNLLVIRLLLERNSLYTLKGGVRLGSQLTQEQAYAKGVDHIALCTGSGEPKLLDIPGKLAKGVRFASDFLMNLQLTGAFKEDSLSTLSIDLPIVIIGGGLTATDAATEALAYYPLQVERTLQRIEILQTQNQYNAFYETLTVHEKMQLEKWCLDARRLRNGEILEDLTCTIIYRKSIEEAPSFKLNAEELYHTFKEGIRFLDEATPLEFITDENQHVTGIRLKNSAKEYILPSRCVLVAVGSSSPKIF